MHELKEIDDKIEIIPTHAFTFWFSLFRSDSGFDSIQECLKKRRIIFMLPESGMSADYSVAWRSGNLNIMKLSDAHSFW